MKFDSNKDYYGILNVTPTAELAVIKAAYKALAAIYHPDKNNSDEAAVRMRKYNEAWEVLSNPENRKAYDAAIGDNDREKQPFGETVYEKEQSQDTIHEPYSKELIRNAVEKFFSQQSELEKGEALLNIILHLHDATEFIISLVQGYHDNGWFKRGGFTIIVLAPREAEHLIDYEELSTTPHYDHPWFNYGDHVAQFAFQYSKNDRSPLELIQGCDIKVAQFVEELITKLGGEETIRSIEVD